MDDVREVAKMMRAEGLIEITQKGAVITDENWRGAIRLKLKKG
jgi:DNA-binding FadR family transcriptional regulator